MIMPKKPAKPVLPFYDQRMIELLDYVVKERVQGLRSRSQALQAIGFVHTNFSQLMRGKQSFKPEHFVKAVELFGVDANFFFNTRHTKMFPQGKQKSVIEELNEVVARVKNELKPPRP